MAIALMRASPGFSGPLISSHLGPEVSFSSAVPSLVCHRDLHPTNNLFASFGSTASGAIKSDFSCWTSVMEYGTGFQQVVEPFRISPLIDLESSAPSVVLRCTFPYTHSP